MKKIITIMVLLALYFFSCKPDGQSNAPVQSRKNKNLAAELLQLEKNRNNAINTLDSNRLKEMVTSDFVLTTVYGELKNVRDIFTNLQASYLVGSTEKHYTKSTQVNIYNSGKLAILRGIYTIEKHEKNGVVVFNARYTDTYAKINGFWLLVASHQSRLKRRNVHVD
jgi:hypothetical protein